MKTQIALTDFIEIEPRTLIAQNDLAQLIIAAHADISDDPEHDLGYFNSMFRRYGVKESQISVRGVESLEVSMSNSSIHERTQFFGQRAGEIFAEIYPEAAPAPGHIVHVSCTGYISPSPAQYIVNAKSWADQTNVTHAYHMGCYAAMPAVRMAEGFVSSGENVVDIVHTEMCTLHLNARLNSPEQLVVQSLFADGNIKYSAVPREQAHSGFAVLSIREHLIKDSQDDMSWLPTEFGMQMTLSREVPSKIGAEIKEFIETLCSNAGLDSKEILENALFAVHPGGPKIIDSVQAFLNLSDDQVAASKNVLFRRGNMSSATLPHVWNELIRRGLKKDQKIISLAFGPGLTIFGSIFEAL